MKKLQHTFQSFLIFSLILGTPVFAATRQSSGPSSVRLGLGFSSYGSGSIGVAATPAIGALLELNAIHSLNFMTGIVSTNPFLFGFTTVYRATVAGDFDCGLHLGGGFNLGTTVGSIFFFNVFPVVGAHVALGGRANNLQINMDGGPIFAITPNFQFSMTPASLLLGASVHYFL